MGRIVGRRRSRLDMMVRRLLVVTSLGFLVAAISPFASIAAVAQPAGKAIQAASAPAGHVTILVLDMSGSMGGNDPNGLRCSAANAYIDLSGPGDFVGVVGLDNTGPTGGAHNFPLAQVWAQPSEMATLAARTQLHDTIATKSHNCKPDSATPTYDALQQALTMLTTATAQTHLPGSVILLTDGVPAPQQNEQINAIQSDLVPQFKQRDFPVDTVALGADGALRSFLSDLANATGGAYYDDGHGVVSGVSPLNIAPFFVSIFAQRNGRTVTHDIPPTALSGGTVSRNFAIGAFVSHLDVVAVKDSTSARVTLTAPNGQVLPPAVAGTFISSDPHYVIFSVDHPQSGAWQLNATGSGRFLMDSLKLSTLGLSILAPASNTPEALGQPLTVSATLNDTGTPITGSRYSMNGTITYSGGGSVGSYTQEFVLDDHASPGTYTAQITIPTSAPAGAYNVTINAREVSDTIASANRLVRIELFPSPLLVAPSTGKLTTDTVATTVTQWDPALRAIYGVPFGVLTWLSGWPLQGHPVVDGARLDGAVRLNGKPYTDATVSGSATRDGAKTAIPLHISTGDNGRFTAAFTPSGDGQYVLTFKTQGSFKDSHGDLGTTGRTVALKTQPASPLQEVIAWVITLLYLFILVLIVLLIRYAISQKPFGRLVSSTGGGEEFSRARRGVYGLLHPGTVLSQQMGLDPGLIFHFQRSNRITVEGSGSGRRAYRLGGDPVPTSPVPAAESLLTTNEGLSYTVSASSSDEFAEEDEGARSGGLLRRRSASDDYDDVDDAGGRRGLFGRRSRNSDYDDDEDRDSRRKSRRARDDYDDMDDYGASRSRGRARGRSRDDDFDDDYSSSGRSRKSRRRGDDDY